MFDHRRPSVKRHTQQSSELLGMQGVGPRCSWLLRATSSVDFFTHQGLASLSARNPEVVIRFGAT